MVTLIEIIIPQNISPKIESGNNEPITLVYQKHHDR